MAEQKPIQNSRKVCTIETEYVATWNYRALEAFYSLRSRKFIRGRYVGLGLCGKILYKLYEGMYIRFTGGGSLRLDSQSRIDVCLVRVSCQDNKTSIEEVACAVVEYESPWWLKTSVMIPRQVFDFFEALPSYRCYPRLDTYRVYSLGQHIELLKFIQSGKRVREEREDE